MVFPGQSCRGLSEAEVKRAPDSGWHGACCRLSIGEPLLLRPVLMTLPSRFSFKLTARRPSRLAASRALVFGLVMALGGCDVALFPEVVEEPTSNVCETNRSCGQDGSCVGGRCQARATQIPALLLEVTPTAGVETPVGRPAIDGLSFISVIDDFERGPNGYEIALEHVSVIKGSVMAPELTDATCLAGPTTDGSTEPPEAGDGSVPARLTLTPRQRRLGLPGPVFTAQSGDTLANVGGGLTGYQIEANVPPGNYDVYVEPAATIDGCLRPPFLIVNQAIPSGNVSFDVTLPVPQVIAVAVRYPRASDDLKDWTLDIVQKDSGRLLSNRAVLQAPVERDGALEYDVQLAFSAVGTGETVASELVRLSPPERVVAPTIYLERSLIDLFQGGVGLVDQLTELDDAVNYRARVTVSGLIEPVPSTVTLFALKLDSSGPGTTAAFSSTVETDENGFFETQLLPGTYRVLATPLDANYARRLVDITVSDASLSQTGRTIEVTPRHVISGKLVSFDGTTSIFGASISAHAVPSKERAGVLASAQGAISLAPAAIGDVSSGDGSFALRADGGVFNISARPEVSTGFAWAIRLGVDISDHHNLSRFQLPLPVIVEGLLTSPDMEGIVPGALIRAYALLKDGVPVTNGDEADSVVAVAEAQVSSDGRFELLLPYAFK